MIKKLLISLILLIALLAGCNQSTSGTSSKDIAKQAFEWEKARFDSDYDRQQELIYKEGSYEVDKTAKKTDSGLKYEDIRYEIYYDKELEQYYVFADFKNPIGENSVKDNILFRKKGGEWKVDTSKSLDIVREEVSKKFDQEACINCK
ncbi:hypothetical protein E2K98_24925 [Bacillus salipaludis]|uniref:DUF4878 domain-containing protein n=1 Tax=Bacillus salipaludis TaxID=2547811 RepID=A0A4R5VKD4_9BACI|nr:hypothetical protein [Bacillus salipaludis]TDK58162.1 hypothetical protein E2K98_24925 [Bacillus salipaludis]